MKLPSIIGSLLLATLATSSALTESDLTEAAITGKTLTFTIETGAPPLATTGSWTGSFGAAPGKSFTMTKVSGDTVNSTGTWSYNSNFSGMYEYTLKPFIAGQPDGYLTIWVSEGGAGRYEIFLNGLFGNSQTGGFTIGATDVKAPEIAVQQPAGSNLADGAVKKSFGTVKVGSKGAAKTFTIKNTGNAKLTGLAIRKGGANKGDFVVGSLVKTSLAPGASMKFSVTFKPRPGDKRKRSAAIAISSNDADENPFDIQLAGEGVN